MNRAAQHLLAIVLCAAITPSLPLGAQVNNGQLRQAKSDKKGSAGTHRAKRERDSVVFTARDRTAIRKYYRGAAAQLPPGLAKRNGNLPPGLRKQLRRNGTLPPGLQKRFEPLSGDLERSLRPLAGGYSRGLVGRDAVIVETRTQRIIDIIRDVTARL